MKPNSLRESLDWDTAFSTYEGLLSTEELCLVNKGFTKSKSTQPSCRTRTKKGYQRPCASVSAVKRSKNIGKEKQKKSDQCLFKESEKKNMYHFGLSRKNDLTDVKGGQQSRVKFGGASSLVQSKSVKPKRQSFLLKSLDIRPQIVASRDQASSPTSSFPKAAKHSKNIREEKQKERDQRLFKESEKENMYHLGLSRKNTDIKDQQSRVKFGGGNSHVQSKSVKPRRQSFVLKSLDWDSASFTCEGLLSPKELCVINKNFKKEESVHSFSGIEKHKRPQKVAPRDQTSSPTSSFPKAVFASDFQTPTHDSCRMLEGRKLSTTPYAMRSSIKEMAFSGLRMPSPRLGFFD